jgi:hypothetical protein
MRPDDRFAVGTRLLFENERIRLWTMEVPPGESWGPHEHRGSYVTVVAEASRIASVMEDGTIELEFDADVDHVDWHAGEGRRVHTLENRGTGHYKNFIVELLDAEGG